MRLYTLAILLGALGGTGACGNDVCEELDGPPSIQLGIGGFRDEFVELQGGETMTLELGPRGLLMVIPSLRLRGLLTPGATRVVPVDRDVSPWVVGEQREPGGRLVVTAVYDGFFVGGGVEVSYWSPDMTTSFVEFWDPTELIGEVVTLHAEVEDGCGNVADDEVDVRLAQ